MHITQSMEQPTARHNGRKSLLKMSIMCCTSILHQQCQRGPIILCLINMLSLTGTVSWLPFKNKSLSSVCSSIWQVSWWWLVALKSSLSSIMPVCIIIHRCTSEFRQSFLAYFISIYTLFLEILLKQKVWTSGSIKIFEICTFNNKSPAFH